MNTEKYLRRIGIEDFQITDKRGKFEIFTATASFECAVRES